MMEKTLESMILEIMPKIERLAIKMTIKYPWIREEAISHGMLALARESVKFDPSRGSSFPAFAMQNARNRICDVIVRGKKPKNCMVTLSQFPEDINEYDSNRGDSCFVGWETEYEDYVESFSSIMTVKEYRFFRAIYLECHGDGREEIASSIGTTKDNLNHKHMNCIRKIRQHLGVTA